MRSEGAGGTPLRGLVPLAALVLSGLYQVYSSDSVLSMRTFYIGFSSLYTAVDLSSEGRYATLYTVGSIHLEQRRVLHLLVPSEDGRWWLDSNQRPFGTPGGDVMGNQVRNHCTTPPASSIKAPPPADTRVLKAVFGERRGQTMGRRQERGNRNGTYGSLVDSASSWTPKALEGKRPIVCDRQSFEGRYEISRTLWLTGEQRVRGSRINEKERTRASS
jgi:hypothetical protein